MFYTQTLKLILAVACMAPGSIAQTTRESIDVPPNSRLLLRAVGRGDQVYGCVNSSWELKGSDAKLFNQEGSVIGRHFAGPTWQLNDGSWVKGKVAAKQVAPDASAVPWLLPRAGRRHGTIERSAICPTYRNARGKCSGRQLQAERNTQSSLHSCVFVL